MECKMIPGLVDLSLIQSRVQKGAESVFLREER